MHRVAKVQRAKPGYRKVKPVPWQAPTLGWRTDVPLAKMPPGSSPILQNFFPEAGYVRARNGSTVWASGLPGQVNTILPYSGSNGTQSVIKLFAASGTNIYDVTSPGIVAGPVVTGQTVDHYSYTQISTPGGKFLVAVNGIDPVQQFNGTAWSVSGFSGNTGPLSAVTTYQSRLYFIQANSTSLWFGGTDAISGTLTQLDIGPNMKFGGTLVALGTWTTIVTAGPIIFLVVISSEGEAVIFQGTDPTQSSSWGLLGTCKMSKPLGKDRCCFQVGGDLAVMTMDGVIPISKAFFLDPAATDQASLTKAIAPTWIDTVQFVGSTSNQWQFITYPHRRMGIVNVPDPTGTYQFVMNTETHAWTKFTNLNASCWALWEDGCYFGDPSGNVVQVETGSADNGKPIDCLGMAAWDFGDGITQRQSNTISIMVSDSLAASIYGDVSVDFTVKTPQFAATSPQTASEAEWDISDWDQANWVGNTQIKLICSTSGSTGVVLGVTFRALISGNAGSFSNTYIYGGAMLVETGIFI